MPPNDRDPAAPARITADVRTSGHLRRRGAQLEQAILDAAWDELAAVGYANLTVAAVAARARTSKAVLYRRWSNRVELATAAIERRVPSLSPDAPDTGTLRGDVLALLRRLARRYRAVQLIPDHDTELTAHLRRQASIEATNLLDEVLHRAEARGEITSAGLRPRIAHLPIDLVHHELFLTNTPVSQDTLVEIVDEIFLPLLAHHAPAHLAHDAAGGS
jgi:AcrR family transcriptional regulator